MGITSADPNSQAVTQLLTEHYDAALTAAKLPHEGYIYPKANHGFHNDTTPRYDEAAAKLAWTRTVAHFNKYVKAS